MWDLELWNSIEMSPCASSPAAGLGLRGSLAPAAGLEEKRKKDLGAWQLPGKPSSSLLNAAYSTNIPYPGCMEHSLLLLS